MLTAAVVLALLTLLVATDADPDLSHPPAEDDPIPTKAPDATRFAACRSNPSPHASLPPSHGAAAMRGRCPVPGRRKRQPRPEIAANQP
jgi:hypothetical protein